MVKKETNEGKSKKETRLRKEATDGQEVKNLEKGIEVENKDTKKDIVKKTTSDVAEATKPVAKAKLTAKKTKKDKSEKVKLPKEERRHSKKYREVAALVDKNNYYTSTEAVELIKKTSTTKFDSSVEIHVRLSVDPTAADQQVRGTVALPNGTGKTKRIAVICSSDKEKEAKDAGADKVGADTLIAEIEKGKLDFDILVASPDMMAQIGKLGKILGTKGLMPNPKAGTVTPEVGKAVKELKAGRVEFKVDKSAIVHQIIGKASFDGQKLEENYTVFMDALKHAKPSGVKGTYIKSINLSTTMGPGIKIEV